MVDVPTPERTQAAHDFLERQFPNAGTTILGKPYLDIRRPNFHDSKAEFVKELKFVNRSATDLFDIYHGMMDRGDVSIATSRGLPLNFVLGAVERNKTEATPRTAHDLVMRNAREVDYWGFSKKFLFDLYLSFSARRDELQEQKGQFWSSKGRPPDHYARIMALRLAKLFAKERKTYPTIGTASDGDHPSTDYGRALQELFEILEIETGFRLPGEWAVAQISEKDVPQTIANALNTGLMPNLMGWGQKKGGD